MSAVPAGRPLLDAEAVLRIVRGRPDAHELAALTALLLSRPPQPDRAPPPRSPAPWSRAPETAPVWRRHPRPTWHSPS
ncbi:acyl-CoA carboxylase epsilon subunit [Streptomyces sp. L2]|uniref:acyl-CoA carboxylase epsilon subunit n=1 Tax=Streptomyces sp. L2 TaxID=2162665 RepID=UPI001010650D|nr:acyl-CoA carboxylase epsilon subunit [Streptomyces sp. L2]